MIIVLHGDDITASRCALDRYIENNSLVIRLDGAKTDETEITQALKSQDLFLEKKAVVIENISGVSEVTLKKLLPLFSEQAKREETIIFWEAGALGAKVLQLLKEFKIEAFTLPSTFYSFLDNVIPKNALTVEKLFQSLPSAISSEQVFYALVKRVRLLLMIKTGNPQAFAEMQRMSSWQLSKLKRQASTWTEEKLLLFYKKLFEIEIGMKTSALPQGLSESLDILLTIELK